MGGVPISERHSTRYFSTQNMTSMMGNIVLLFVFLVAWGSLAQCDDSFIFTNGDVIVKPGDIVPLNCGIVGEFRYCVWEHGQDIFQTEDIHSDVYPGMSQPFNTENNQCGIELDNISAEDQGEWTCKIFIKGGSKVGKNNVFILDKPEITPSKLTANADEETKVTCRVMSPRHAAELSWFLDSDDITENAEVEDTGTADGTLMKISTLTRTFIPIENKKTLKCVVTHPSLDEPEHTTVPLTVKYAPVGKLPQTFYELKKDNDYEIWINFTANPRPFKKYWQYGNSFDELTDKVDIPPDDDRLKANKLVTSDNGDFIAVLKISSLNETDFQRKYNLFVENEIGSTTYLVTLSRGKLGEEVGTRGANKSAGTIIGIIVAVIAPIAAIVGIVFFLKRKEKFCFNPGNTQING
ncbi:unnamed protein product, partial [Meganyctiphanes norvegica]